MQAKNELIRELAFRASFICSKHHYRYALSAGNCMRISIGQVLTRDIEADASCTKIDGIVAQLTRVSVIFHGLRPTLCFRPWQARL